MRDLEIWLPTASDKECRVQKSRNTSSLMLKTLLQNYNQILLSSLSYFLRMDLTLQTNADRTPTQNHTEALNQKVQKKKNQEIDFISQFLELPLCQSPLHHHNSSQTQEKKQVSVATSETFQRSDSNLENSLSQPKFKSIFHNFQKHLVVTLRSGIKMRAAHRRDPVLHLAFQMWRVFADSHLACKKVLHFLFGVAHLTVEENYLQARNYALPGAEQLLVSHSADQLAAAQQQLRAEVIRQGLKMLQRNGLSQRRMQKSNEFQSYFLSFLEELQAGPLSRRLPKSQKLEIIKEIQRIKDETT